MSGIRIYHAILAILAVLSYLTGELGIIHAWLGYGVTIVIAFRLLWAASSKNPKAGLMRFYPVFKGLGFFNAHTHPAIGRTLILAVAISLSAATISGLIIDKGASIGLVNMKPVADAYANDDNRHRNGETLFEEVIEEIHEFFSNLFLLLVGMHAGYMLVFKHPLARYMLFLPNRNKKE